MFRRLSARIFFMLQTPKAQNVNEVYDEFKFVLSAASVRTGRSFLSQDCGKSDFLEFICTHCEAFMIVQ